MDELRISGDRLLADLEALSHIGATSEGGLARTALSDADLAAREWFVQRAKETGLETQHDGAGNVSAILPSESPAAQTIMCGSHLDTVPNGGRFDGALGVVAALEVLRTIKEANLSLPYTLEAMSFTDEEGTWIGLMGSRALTGTLTDDDLDHARGSSEALNGRLAAAGLTRQSVLTAVRDPNTLRAWIEIHIEQGTRLEEAKVAIGVVPSIVGISSFWLTFLGRADHAGTTPFERRRDALRGVVAFVQQARELVINRFPRGVMNVGEVEVSPGAFNIVPEQARLALEFRHSDPTRQEAMREALLSLALHVVEIEQLGLDVQAAGSHPPAPMHTEVSTAIYDACRVLDLTAMETPSYAGHDSQSMSSVTSAGMFFVPSVAGASHSPRELTRDEDCINAGNVLLHAISKIAEK